MSIRFEVLCNGQRVCLSGIDGDGVLSVSVTYVKHPGDDGDVGFHVGGLGRYDGSIDAPHHVGWPAERIDVGDEIAIRILPPGEFDEPDGMTSHPQETREDDDFGTMSLYVDAWLADVPFPFPPLDTARVRIRAGKRGPTRQQRERYQELVRRFPALWSEIAPALVRCHQEIETIEELDRRIESRVGIGIDAGKSATIDLTFSFADDPEGRGYFVTLRNWQIVEVSAAD